MERFYSWRVVKDTSEHGKVEALVICYNGCLLNVDHVYRDIEEALKEQHNLPDCVYLVGNSAQTDVFTLAWDPTHSRLDSVLKRGLKYGIDFVKQYTCLKWDGDGFTIHGLGGTGLTYTFDASDLLTQGMLSLVQKNNAIHSAPSGHVFKHPSGSKNKVFIQAREIASGEAELFVVGYAIALRYGDKLKQASQVLIDTMGVYAYVKNALIHCGGTAEILSFHSYDELEKINPPSGNYFCIVSASTSGRMAAKMGARKFDENCVATIIDVSSKGRFGSVLLPLDSLGLKFPELALSTGTQIEIIGENFTSKAKPPRAVIIGLKHAPEALDDIHKYFGLGGILGFNTALGGGGRRKLLQLDPAPMLSNPVFSKWLEEEINWSLPLAITTIIHADDEGSRLLAVEVLRHIKLKLANSDSITLVPHQDLQNIDFTAVKGVLVVSAVSRDGGVLREISRDLRSYIKAEVPRHFITPVGLPQTSESWRQLEIFLTKNPTERSYGFSNWLRLPIGDDSQVNVWSRLADLGSNAQMLDVEELNTGSEFDAQATRESLNMASEEINGAFGRLLASPRGEELKLSEGFLFFQKDSAIAEGYERVNQSTVYLSIAAVMQYAREHKDHALQMRPTGYESVVLAPECFLRFNDNILQACFLRACLPCELDYSASPELSKLMKELLLKIFIRWNSPYGDAALEFAASIALGSLRLTREDMDLLLEESMAHVENPSTLMGLLILAKHNWI